MHIINKLIKQPTITYSSSGKPIASINKLQAWAYPELCKEQFEMALSYCTPEQATDQRMILQAYFPKLYG